MMMIRLVSNSNFSPNHIAHFNVGLHGSARSRAAPIANYSTRRRTRRSTQQQPYTNLQQCSVAFLGAWKPREEKLQRHVDEI